MTHRVFDVRHDTDAALDAAVDAVRAGEVIVLPTDTVYGVGVDAFSAEAVQRLFDAKQRGRDMPPPVLVAELPQVRAFASGVDERVSKLAESGWPGPLTLVLQSQPSLRLDLGDRGDTIAVRIPDHDFTRELLRRTGPLAVSSANVSGSEAALTVEDAISMLGDAVSVYLDDGPASGPQPSTILDMSGPEPSLLRAGRLGAEALNAMVPGLLPEDEPTDLEGESTELVDDEAEPEPDPLQLEAPHSLDPVGAPARDDTGDGEPLEPGPTD